MDCKYYLTLSLLHRKREKRKKLVLENEREEIMRTYIDVGYNGYKLFHDCYVKNIGRQKTFYLEEFNWHEYTEDTKEDFRKKEKLIYETNDRICWTYLLRYKKNFEKLNEYFSDYLINQNIESLCKVEKDLYDFEIPYFRGKRAKPLIIEEIAFELYNEFYSNQLNENFENIEISERNFIIQRIKPTLEPYLKKCGLFGSQKGIDKCLEEVIKDFKKILLDPDYKYNGKKDTPLEKINLAIRIFDGIVELHKTGKLERKKLEDFLTNNNLKELHIKSYPISRYIMNDLRKTYISEILNTYEKIKDENGNLIIRSFASLILLEMRRFLDERPNVAVCERCDQVFIGGHKNAKYCSYFWQAEKCDKVGKVKKRKKQIENHPGLKEYDKIYSRMNKRVTAEKNGENNSLLYEKRNKEFKEWTRKATCMKRDYIEDSLSTEEFIKNINDEFERITMKKL